MNIIYNLLEALNKTSFYVNLFRVKKAIKERKNQTCDQHCFLWLQKNDFTDISDLKLQGC